MNFYGSSHPGNSSRRKRGVGRIIVTIALIISNLFVAARQASPALAAPILNIQPITWNVVGLDSNNVNVGPNNFPVGARVCNTGPDPATNLVATFVWDSANANINLRSGSLNPITLTSLASGACTDLYFEIIVTRTTAAYDTARRFHIEVTASNFVGTLSTPTPREIYVERLVSQNRNSITDLLVGEGIAPPPPSMVSIPAGGTMNLIVGREYTIQLVGATATNGYEQIETFINFPNTIFQILNVRTTYGAVPVPGTDPNAFTKLYADGCGWVNDPTSPAYRSCTGVGKYGGNVTITYEVRIINGGGTSNVLNALIYDFSGSSYHYNTDFETAYRIAVITDLSLCTRVPIATWSFNNNTLPTPAGSGTFSASNITQTGFPTVTGNLNNPAVGYTAWAAAFSAANFLQFAVGTQGYYSIALSFGANQAGGNSPTTARVAYSTNGTTFTSLIPDLTLSTTWTNFTPIDLTSITALDNNPNAAFRIIAFGGVGGTQANIAVNFDTVTVSGCELPRSLSLAKAASLATYNTLGQTVTYTYTLVNTGLATLTAPYGVSDNRVATVNCAGATSPLLPGASTTCTGTYTITRVDLDAGSVNNTASATATVGAATITSNNASATITAVQNPALSIVKTATPTTYSAVNQVISYSYQVINSGNVTLAGPFTVSDDRATNESCPATASLAPGASITCTASYTITQADLNAGSVVNIASASNGTVTSPTDTATVTAVQNPDLTLAKTASPVVYVNTGDVINYTLTATNTGNVTLSNVVITDPLLGALTCAQPVNLPPGGSLQCMGTHTITAADLTNGSVQNIATVTGNDPGGSPITRTGTTTVNWINATADLRLTKAVDNLTPAVGANVVFTIVLINDGPSNATNIRVADLLPSGFTFVSVTPSQGTYNNGSGAWNVGNLAVNASATLAITAQVNVSGSYVNTAEVVAVDQPDPDSTPNNGIPTEDDQSTVTVTPRQGNPNQITKDVTGTSASHTTDPDVIIGEIVTYRVTVTLPPGQFTNAFLVDTMDRGLAFVDCQSIAPSSANLTTSVTGGFTTGICQDTTGTQLVVDDPIGTGDSRDAGRRVRFILGTLTNASASDQTLTFTYRAVVLNSKGNTQGLTLANRAIFNWTGNSIEALTSSVVIREPELAITKSVDSGLVGKGSVLTFTLRITHSAASRANAYDVEINDPLPAGLEFISGTLNCTTGAQDPNISCDYVAATRSINARWSSFTLGGGDGILRFSVRVDAIPASSEISNTAVVTWTSLPGTPPGYDSAHMGVQSRYNPLSTERTFDPSDPNNVNLYGTRTTLNVGLVVATPVLPATGFAPGVITDIRAVPQTLFSNADDLVLEIPTLGVKLPIVGVPLKKGFWDLTWLGNQAGWLEGTAYPTWNGNSLVTAHVYGANGKPGPFYNLSKLRWGDQILIHAYSQVYVYEVRSNRNVMPDDMSVLRHEERAWITLLTCKGFDEKKGSYDYRVAVSAVLVRVSAQP